MWGTDGAGAQTLQCSEVGDREPGEQGLASVGGDGIGERRRCGTQGVFGDEQEAVAFVARVGGKQKVAAGDGKGGGGGTARIQGIGRCTVEGAREQDGTMRVLGEVDESRQGTAPAREGGVRVDDEQDDVFGGDGFL